MQSSCDRYWAEYYSYHTGFASYSSGLPANAPRPKLKRFRFALPLKHFPLLLLAILSLPTELSWASDLTLTISGEPELFLAQDGMNCKRSRQGDARDQPDVPLTAFRRKDNSVVVIASNQNNYILEGTSIDDARRKSCDRIVETVNDPDPSTYNGRRWLFALHAIDYGFVLGFVHNEYHGDEFAEQGCEVSSRQNFECWYSAVTLVLSTDGGFSFVTPPPAENVLAAPPVAFSVRRKRVGVDSPKVVGNPHDKMVYVMVNDRDLNHGRHAVQCLLRGSGKSLDDWRAWNGKAFALSMGSPYTTTRKEDCQPVLDFPVSSLKYIPATDMFVALGTRQSSVVYAFSPDLLNWTTPQELLRFNPKQTWKKGQSPAKSYFSLLDPDSSSINFDTLERNPYLFYVQYDTDEAGLPRRRQIYRMRIDIR